MARDGSSGGVIRMAAITQEGVERTLVTGDDLPRTFNSWLINRTLEWLIITMWNVNHV